MDKTPPPVERSLPRELTDFLIELSIALQKFAIYPVGHPMLETTVERLERRLLPLLDDRPSLSLGVARNQLVIEGVATDPAHAVLRDLADRLHRHHLGAVRISRGVSSWQLRDMLLVLGAEHAKDAAPVGLLPEGELPTWSHVKLFPLAYAHLELLEEDRADSAAPPERGRDGARAARLWVGLARAALAGRETSAPNQLAPGTITMTDGSTALVTGESSASPDARDAPEGAGAEAEAADNAAADPLAVAKAIDEHQREAAYDQVIVGYLLQIADELKGEEGRDTTALRGRVSRLVSAMKPETLRTLMSMSNDNAQRRQFVLDATKGMAVHAVVELVRAGADVSKQTISHSMLRLLSKLATHAEHDTPARRVDADSALRENVRTLVSQWSLEDPNPTAYRAVLDGMSRAGAPDLTRGASYPVEDERIFQMSLEIGVAGEPTWRSLEQLIARGRLTSVLAMLDRGPRPRVAEQIWDALATPDRLRKLLADREPEWPALERIIIKLGLGAAEALFDVLDDTADAKRQLKLLSLLAKLGDDIGSAAVRRLPQATPALQARLLGLIGRLGKTPDGFNANDYAGHRDPGVRREALKLLFRRPQSRDNGIIRGLTDPDERTVLLTLNEASASCPRTAISVLMNRVDRDDIPGSLRALAIRTAASVKLPDVVDWVLRFVMVGRKSFFFGDRMAPKSPELLAALAGLAAHWQGEPRAQSVLARALKHPDPEIRAAAQTPLRASAEPITEPT